MENVRTMSLSTKRSGVGTRESVSAGDVRFNYRTDTVPSRTPKPLTSRIGVRSRLWVMREHVQALERIVRRDKSLEGQAHSAKVLELLEKLLNDAG